MKKLGWEVLLLLAIIVAGGYLMLNPSSSTQGTVTGNVVAAGGQVQEVVLGMKDYNYYPNTITVDSGNTVRLSMDDSAYGCFRDFTLRDFGVRKHLATPSDYVEFVADKKGTYTFSCSMGMGLGKLVVK